jgi:hypothetical protein
MILTIAGRDIRDDVAMASPFLRILFAQQAGQAGGPENPLISDGKRKSTRKQLRPNIESLETKSLLSQMALGSFGHTTAGAAPAAIAPAAGSVEYSLTTGQTSDMPGQTVRMTFTKTNDADNYVVVGLEPRFGGSYVTSGGQTIWSSNAGPTPDYVERVNPAPGASITLAAAWTASSVTGTYVAHNKLDPDGATATFEIV